MLNLDINHTAESFVVETLPAGRERCSWPPGELDIATVMRPRGV